MAMGLDTRGSEHLSLRRQSNGPALRLLYSSTKMKHFGRDGRSQWKVSPFSRECRSLFLALCIRPNVICFPVVVHLQIMHCSLPPSLDGASHSFPSRFFRSLVSPGWVVSLWVTMASFCGLNVYIARCAAPPFLPFSLFFSSKKSSIQNQFPVFPFPPFASFSFPWAGLT